MFNPDKHIKNVFTQAEMEMLSSDGSILRGIVGVAGAAETIDSGVEIGVDRIIMRSGMQFEPHTHPGAHILFVLRSRGFVHVDGVDYEMVAGDTIYIPANYAHAVKTNHRVAEPLELLAFGVPHMPVSSAERMTVVSLDTHGRWRASQASDHPGCSWEVATDAAEVHALLCACDSYQVSVLGLPAPNRRMKASETLVRDQSVHVLRRDGEAIAMFTLTPRAPFDQDIKIFPEARKSFYLQRLAVKPELLARGSVLGAQCIRKAIELATRSGADAVRCEANPDLVSTRELLDHLGFEQYGLTLSDNEGRRRVYLQKTLRP
ncbi:MAG: GNAT family N-acetyltransferase [Egibacteraceae bacterium]